MGEKEKVCNFVRQKETNPKELQTMEKNDFKVGVIGTGWIAEKAAITLAHVDGMRVYAVGSRKLETAEAFAKK